MPAPCWGVGLCVSGIRGDGQQARSSVQQTYLADRPASFAGRDDALHQKLIRVPGHRHRAMHCAAPNLILQIGLRPVRRVGSAFCVSDGDICQLKGNASAGRGESRLSGGGEQSLVGECRHGVILVCTTSLVVAPIYVDPMACADIFAPL